ncbi:hypothetical protein ACFQ5D_12280 [Paenibacillus farraposensis]|uniref:Uncharacterized protein n=1 Tax=Paenibacillus farraposensis TaxID=2807095 RepID=A0ABW4DG63_9BACL|nr:hypothetical protein [Paenibacillus farraposensis]MCC3381110.1 hypothetical protein [Paenibacillus farraposensis]
MKTWIFAGLCDKSDTMLYISSILAASGQQVLLVDATLRGQYRYSIGMLDQPLPITQFSGFDVATGFGSWADLNIGMMVDQKVELAYDIVILDVELPDFCPISVWKQAARRIWVSDYSRILMHKGRMWLEQLFDQPDFPKDLVFDKLFLQAVDCGVEESYLWEYMNDFPAYWNGNPYVLPWDEGHLALKLENEHKQQLQLKPLSRMYKKELCRCIGEWMGWELKESQRALKRAERRRV